MSAVEKIKHLFYLGDVREKLLEIPEKSVQCVVTSPPYWGLRDYGLPPSVWGGSPECEHEWGVDEISTPVGNAPSNKSKLNDGKGPREGEKYHYSNAIESSRGRFCRKCGAWLGCLGLEPTPELYVKHMVEIFRGVWRVLRDDGTVWLNLGDSYAGSGGPGSQYNKAAGKYKNEFKKYENPNRKVDNLKPKDLVGIPWAVAFALRADGWYLRSDIIWHKPDPMPESVTDRPTKAHEYIFLLTKKQKYFYDAEAVKEPATDEEYRTKGKVRPGPETAVKIGKGFEIRGGLHNQTGGRTSRNRRSVWTISTQLYPEAHFATFPPKLIEPCILAGTSPRACEICGAPWERVVAKTDNRHWTERGNYNSPKMQALKATGFRNDGGGGFEGRNVKTIGWQPTCTCQNSGNARCIVLDPFAGSGTTNLVAQTLGRDSIYIDRSKEYLNMALKRLGLQERKLKRMLDTVQFQIFGAKEGDEL